MQKNIKTNLGERIIQFRKEKGMTQQQLADSVGVSAPAVSKWETNVSYPDITLLCPIARVLDVSVDQLLHFDKYLSKTEIEAFMNEIIMCSRNENVSIAEEKLVQLLYTYPTDFNLKYHAATVFLFFRMQHPREESEENLRWKAQYKKLLEEIKLAGRSQSSYYEKVISSLTSVALAEENLKEAKLLLDELSEDTTEYALLWAQYYVKTGEEQKALEVTQKRLYLMVRKTQMSMISMMNASIIKDPLQVLEICKIYRQIEEIFQIGGETSEGFFVEAYKRIGDTQKVKEHAVKMINQFLGDVKAPNPILFSPNVVVKEGEPVANIEMRKMLYEGILNEEWLQEYQQDEQLTQAIQKLKESLTEVKEDTDGISFI